MAEDEHQAMTATNKKGKTGRKRAAEAAVKETTTTTETTTIKVTKTTTKTDHVDQQLRTPEKKTRRRPKKPRALNGNSKDSIINDSIINYDDDEDDLPAAFSPVQKTPEFSDDGDEICSRLVTLSNEAAKRTSEQDQVLFKESSSTMSQHPPTSTISRPPSSGQAAPTPQSEFKRTESSSPALKAPGSTRQFDYTTKELRLSTVVDRLLAPSVQPRNAHCDIKEKETAPVRVPVPDSVSVDVVPSSMISGEPVPESGLVLEEAQIKRPPVIARHANSYAHRLPKGWHANMSKEDQEWIGRNVFHEKGNLSDPARHWHHPPEKTAVKMPVPGEFFRQRLFVWAPRMAYKFDFKCLRCSRSLKSKGLYDRVRPVLDRSSFYYVAAEYYSCGGCGMTLIAYDQRILDQLPYVIRNSFPAILTHKYACDRLVVSMLRLRTVGNSPSSLQAMLSELHTENWLRKNTVYLHECLLHSRGIQGCAVPGSNYQKADGFKVIPKAEWFLACYARDVWTRLETLKASLTNVFGSILRVDATKKICKKLAGNDACSANVAVNFGNEHGMILQSVITSSESSTALQPVADGLMDRYADAGVAPPVFLYTDRDCCKQSGKSAYQLLFHRWSDLTIRLDIWHFMRRLAVGCTSESHPLYGVFMARLSGCIFEWDAGDVSNLAAAKRGELMAAGVRPASDEAVRMALTSRELKRHCKRRTRGTEETTALIEELLLQMSIMTDVLGVPIFETVISDIWTTEKKHVPCLQDLGDMRLYAVVQTVTKGGIELPVYRCGRGTTSLECFHRHIKDFIPGTSANAVNFQAYLIDGVTRWNMSCREAAEHRNSMYRSFDSELVTCVNDLHASVHGSSLIDRDPPAKYTGEKFGMEFLCWQNGMSFNMEDIDRLVDEISVWEDDENGADSGIAVDELYDDELPGVQESLDTRVDNDVNPLDSDQSDADDDVIVPPEDSTVNWQGIPGWDKVDRLAVELLSLKGLCVTKKEAERVSTLYDELDPYDKRPLTYQSVIRKPSSGRFARSTHRSGYIGIEAVARCFITAGSPALPPSQSRIVEALCIHLLEKFPSSKSTETDGGRKVTSSRWSLMLSAYNKVRARLFYSQQLLAGTGLTLFSLNETQISRWFKAKTRREEVAMLLQGRFLPGNLSVAAEELPAVRPVQRLVSSAEPVVFPDPEDRTGKAKVRNAVPKPRTKPVPLLPKPATMMTSAAAATTMPPTPFSSSTASGYTRIVTAKPQSRSAAYRQQKRREIGLENKERKVYSCTFCKQPCASIGHHHYFGSRYCHKKPDLPPFEEWLAARKKEREEKLAKKQSQSKE